MDTVSESYLATFMTIGALNCMAMLSPGPDFAIILRNSLSYSRRVGVFTALGIALGTVLHITYLLFGLGALVKQSIALFTLMKVAGSAYLIWIGIKAIKSKKEQGESGVANAKKDVSDWVALRQGFLTNALNPKCILYFLSVFTLVIDADTPTSIVLAYGVEMTLLTVAYFVTLSLILSHRRVRKWFSNVGHVVERVTGGLLVALGIKLVLSRVD